MERGENPLAARQRIEELEARLQEAEDTLRAIRSGEVDALVISGPEGEQIYTLKTAEHPYRVLVEAMGEGALTLDHEGMILYCNQSFAALLKRLSERVVGATFSQFIALADQPRFEVLLQQARSKSAKAEVTLIASDENEVPVHLSFSPLPLDDLQGVSIVVTDLTEQKRQQELVASERLLRSILEHAAEATVVCNVQGQIIHASRRATELCGSSPVLCAFDEVLPLLKAFPAEFSVEACEDETAAPGRLTFCDILESQELRGVEAILRRPDGQVVDLLLSAGRVLNLKGEMLGCVVTLIDITERKRAEAALQDSESRLRAIFDGTYEFIGLLSPAGTVLEANHAALDWVEQTREAIVGKHFGDTPWWTNTPGAADQVRQAIQRAASGESVRQEVPLRNPRGEVAVFDFSLHPIRNEQGKVTLLVPECRDITDRVKVAQEVERRYRHGIKLTETNRALVGTFEFDQVSEIICRAARELTGADGATFVLREGEQVRYVSESAIAPLWKGRSFPIECCISGWAMLHGETAVIENIYADQRIPLEAYSPTFVKSLLMTPVGPGTPVASIGVYWAHSHKASSYEVELLQSLASAADLALAGARAYEQARQAWAEAEQANHLKDEFLATLSHELRNPLNSIVGYADVLLRSREAKQVPLIQQAAATIHRNAAAQTQLVNDLLDLSRLQTGKLAIDHQPIALAAIVGDAVQSVRSQAAAKEQKLVIDFPGERLLVLADSVRVQQIVWNLVNNAVKFTPKGGQVSVRLSREGTAAQLVVEDTGQGIAANFLPHVFEMFRQSEGGITRTHGGMGIGLALVKQLVELHGGHVEAHSDGPGLGARFTVRLPLHTTVHSAQPAPKKRKIENSLPGARILVVDDSEDALEMLSFLLVNEGALVTTATNGKEGLQLALDAEFDLIISDISMPVMDGYDLLKNLRTDQQRYASIPAIALTGFGRTEDVERARQAGFTTHLTKPLDFDHLLQLARGTLQK
jgi:PAS domain S-box-containing protein